VGIPTGSNVNEGKSCIDGNSQRIIEQDDKTAATDAPQSSHCQAKKQGHVTCSPAH